MRNHSIDTIRGIAIMIMIFANSWPYLYPFETCPVFLRIIFSTAAPIFVFLSGVSICLASNHGKRPIDILKRGIQVLIMGAGIDTVIWLIVPFYTFDVLYLIAISTIILSMFCYLDFRLQVIMTVLVFILFFILNKSYRFEMDEINIGMQSQGYSISNVLRRMSIDGWFPLLPWLGIAFLGYISYSKRNLIKKRSKYLLIAGIISVIIYFIWMYFSTPPPLRNGYTELFYPINSLFLLYIIGVFSIICYFFNYPLIKRNLLEKAGKISLTIYLFHALIIKFYLPLFTPLGDINWLVFIFGILSFYLIIFILTLVIHIFLSPLKKGKLQIIGRIIGL